ncbi:lipase secretion chaperone [Spartinivicinus poritis]|uniref:Lipase chaperone n=1 Tax=Spartinivicinus poritis TaxID=2994640 RepID=A0ABT5U335_9GAMM|nr:lipase secretion chaperone [Spartinivicinus sp. A2-2]MDE1460780.1 lipase secretion chaperone [Spartinivicinus sp. A2-2]
MKRLYLLNRGYGWGVLIIALAAIWQLLISQQPSRAPQAVVPDPSDTIPHTKAAAFKHPSTLTLFAEANLPRSLQHTAIDGYFPVDEKGHLIATQAVKERFDYFLSILGEEGFDQVINRIKADITQQLVSPAKEEALHLLSRYLDYKTALADYEQLLTSNLVDQRPILQLFQEHQAMLNSLRQQFFSPATVDAFFGFDQQYSDWVYQRLSINSDTTLSTREKAVALEQLNTSLATDSQVIFTPDLQETQLQSITDELRQQGATADIIYTARAEIMGEAAAARLARLDQTKMHWQQRLQQFRQAYQTIATQQHSQADIQLAVKNLLNQQFSPQEQLRIKTLEKLPDTLFTTPTNSRNPLSD